MRRIVRDNLLIPQGYDPGVTRLDRAAFGRKGAPMGSNADARSGPIRTNDIPFTLVAGEPLNIATANKFRRGLILTNKDPVNNLFYKFGGQADANSAFLVPNQYILLDVTCPTDAVWVFATVALAGHYMDFAPTT